MVVVSPRQTRRWSLVVDRWQNQSWRNVLLGGFVWSLLLGYTSLQFLNHSEQAVSRVDLFILREVVSQYTLDHQRAPRSFYELKIAGYLNSVPSFVNEHEVFVAEPQVQDPPLEVPLPDVSAARKQV